MALIGCDNFHYSVMETEETKDAAPVYDETEGMTAIPGLIKLEVQPTTNAATLYADNGPALTATSLGEITVNLEMKDIPQKDLAALLGHSYDESKKEMVYKSTDVAPYVAIGFASLMNGGESTRFVKLYKGKFQEANDDAQTKGESIEFKTPSITGKFVVLANNDMWKLTKDADKADVETTATKFFSKVFPTD